MNQSYRVEDIDGVCIYKVKHIKDTRKREKVKVIKNKLKIKSMGK